MTTNYTKWPRIVPTGHKIFQMVITYTNINVPFKGPPKFTKIGIFGLKTNHLATLGLSSDLKRDYAMAQSWYISFKSGLSLRQAGSFTEMHNAFYTVHFA
jgi:hypothetical protein